MNPKSPDYMSDRSQRPTYLFVLPWSLTYAGGVNQVVLNLAKEMMKHGSFEPIVLITDWNAVLPEWDTIEGIRTLRWRVRPYSPEMTLKQRITYRMWQCRFASRFRRFCKEHSVAVINQHYANPSAFTLCRAARSLDPIPPLLVSFHGADLTTIAGSPPEVISAWRSLLLGCRAVVACSANLGSRLVSTFGNDLSPVVVYNGVNATALVSDASNSMQNTRRLILTIGRFETKKGQDVLIRAFVDIRTTYQDVDLKLIGAADITLDELKRQCVDAGVEKWVEFITDLPHEHIATFLRQATIFVLPSLQEPFGIVLLEAGSFSLPVVASDVGGIPEVITDGVTGRLVPAGDSHGLATALKSLLDNPQEAKAMGERLCDHVQRQFTWSAAHEGYMRLISNRTS